jgi:hypothetical protein
MVIRESYLYSSTLVLDCCPQAIWLTMRIDRVRVTRTEFWSSQREGRRQERGDRQTKTERGTHKERRCRRGTHFGKMNTRDHHEHQTSPHHPTTPTHRAPHTTHYPPRYAWPFLGPSLHVFALDGLPELLLLLQEHCAVLAQKALCCFVCRVLRG